MNQNSLFVAFGHQVIDECNLADQVNGGYKDIGEENLFYRLRSLSSDELNELRYVNPTHVPSCFRVLILLLGATRATCAAENAFEEFPEEDIKGNRQHFEAPESEYAKDHAY